MENEARFRRMWAKTKLIHGAFIEVEARKMFSIAMALQPPAEIVEVGTFHGRSASLLGQIARLRGHHLTCVDSFVGVPKGSPYKGKGTGIDCVLRNLDKLGIRFTMMMMPSIDAARRFVHPIDLLFTDSDHSYEAAGLDCKIWLPKLSVGGWAMFHDSKSTDPRKGVGRALTEWCASHGDYEDHGVPETGGGTTRLLRRVE